MKSTQIIAVTLLCLVSVAAVAETAPTQASRDAANVSARNNYPVVTYQSSKTRAEVIAELEQAQRNGLIVNDNSYPRLTTVSPGTRAELKGTSRQEIIQEAEQSAVEKDKSLYSGA
jgi:hypothetical protein